MPFVARGSSMLTTTIPFLPLLVLCSFALLHSASSLKCYDCLSAALPACLDGSMGKEFDVTTCGPEEKVCSVLKMKDGEGNLVVSRQCSTGPEEVDKMFQLLEAAVQGKLELESFDVCETDECNASRRGAGEGPKGSAGGGLKGDAAPRTPTSWTSTAVALVLTAAMVVLAR